jgi:hypothetical protein
MHLKYSMRDHGRDTHGTGNQTNRQQEEPEEMRILPAFLRVIGLFQSFLIAHGGLLKAASLSCSNSIRPRQITPIQSALGAMPKPTNRMGCD